MRDGGGFDLGAACGELSAQRAVIPRLLAITDRALASDDEICARADALLRLAGDAASAIAVGLRDHVASARERLSLGRRLAETCARRKASLIVHDRVDLALALGAAGVQLGFRSVSVADARMLLDAQQSVSVACHDEPELRAAARQGADFVTLSPLYASPGKGVPLGERAARSLTAATDVPVVALGGIDASSAAHAMTTGAHGIAVIRAWLVGDELAALAAWARGGA